MGVDDANASGIADTNSAKGDGANSGRDSILSRKLKKIVECDLEADVELQEALQELSIFFPENTLRTRRFLRGDVERRSLHISREFLSELDGVRQAVNEVADVFVSLTHSAQAMQRQLEATKAKTRDLIRQTSALQAEGQALAVQEATVHQFIVDYQLTVEQMTSLREGEVGDQFFSALDRAQDIHRNCKGLLQSGQHSTALEVMDQMSQFQEAALERLYRWAQSQCRTVDTPRARPDQGGGGDLLARAMRHLLRRPVMFRYVLDEYCSARRAVLVRTFIDALTAGGPGGTPKPIELHAHDPPRYIGDMLAWLHQAIPGEKENAMSLLKLCKDPPPPTEAAEGTEAPPAADVAQLCEEALASVTEEVCRPLRTRVEQILLLEQSPLVLHRLSSLVRFYMGTIKQIIPETGALLQTLADLDQLAYKQFLSVLQTTVHQHLSLTAPNSSTNGPAGGSNVVAAAAAASGPSVHDLAPTRSSTALLNLLKEILSTSSVVDEQESQLAEIVSSVVDPILDDVASIASTLPTTDADVFQLNSIYQIHSALALFQYNDARLQSLQSDMQLHLDTLSSEQTSCLIANLGLQPICTMVAERQNSASNDVPLAHVPGMEASVLREFLSKFDSLLVAPDVFLLPQTRLLVSSAHRKNVTRRSLEVTAASYAQLYHAVVEAEESGYDNPKALMPKTPEQVGLLLQL